MKSDLFGIHTKSGWEEGFAALTTFKAREGHCRVPPLHVEGTFKLGQWVNRTAHKAKTRCLPSAGSGWMRSDLFGIHSKAHGKKALRH